MPSLGHTGWGKARGGQSKSSSVHDCCRVMNLAGYGGDEVGFEGCEMQDGGGVCAWALAAALGKAG